MSVRASLRFSTAATVGLILALSGAAQAQLLAPTREKPPTLVAGDKAAVIESTTIAGPPYAGWDWTKVNPFTANASGNYNKTLKTKTFPISIAAGDTGFIYYVNVHLADGTVIACGVFKGSRKATPKYKKAQAKKKKKQQRQRRRGHHHQP